MNHNISHYTTIRDLNKLRPSTTDGVIAIQRAKAEILKSRIPKMPRISYPSAKFGRYAYSAKSRNREFSLSYEEFTLICSMPCAYCGEASKDSGIDRIDNSKGYTTANSAPCCRRCNLGKHTGTYLDFIDHCRKVAAFNQRRA